MLGPCDKMDYTGVVDVDLERREFRSLDEISDPEEQALALIQDVLYRFVDIHYLDPGDDGEPQRTRDLALAVQVLAVAARLPLLARITQLEERVEALERQLNPGTMFPEEDENGR